MVKFSVEIAGFVYVVVCEYASTKTYCQAHLTDKPAGYSLEITAADIDAERKTSAEQDIKDGITPINYSDAYLETLVLLRKIAEYAPNADCLLFHCSAIMVDGKGYLFTAPSGTGKSTHARLWREMLGDRAVMVNDDKPFLHKKGEQFFVCGTPWNGKHKLGNPVCAPIAGICWLQQSKENQIRRLTPAEALSPLIAQCYVPKNPIGAVNALALIDGLLSSVPVYRLECNISREAAELSFDTLSK